MKASMAMKWLAGLAWLFAAGSALAQGKPSLVDCPLDVKAAVSDTVAAELQDDFRLMLARAPGVLVPTKTNWKLVVAAHKRSDCEVRNDCLQQLAISGGTLYAMYTSVEKNAAGDVTATGRVVNQDGVVAREPQSVTVPKRSTFQDGAREALGQLLTKLKLPELSPVLERPKEEKKPTETIVVVKEAPPPASGLRTAGFVTGALALAGGAVAAGFGVSALTTRGALPANGHFTSEDQARGQASVNQGATLALVSGSAAVALAATSVVLFVLSAPSPSASVSAAPTPGGATLMFTGRF